MNSLSVDNEFRYIVQWFNEWSELQREDFVAILVDYIEQHDAENGGENYVNGVAHSVANVSIGDKPMSLFQCRIKLFREWSPKWPTEFKNKLKEKITELDPKIGELIHKTLKGANGNCTDLHINGNDTDNSIDGVEAQTIAEAIVVATEDAIGADERLMGHLNNQTAAAVADGDGKTLSAEVVAEPAEQVLMHIAENVAVDTTPVAPLAAAITTTTTTAAISVPVPADITVLANTEMPLVA